MQSRAARIDSHRIDAHPLAHQPVPLHLLAEHGLQAWIDRGGFPAPAAAATTGALRRRPLDHQSRRAAQAEHPGQGAGYGVEVQAGPGLLAFEAKGLELGELVFAAEQIHAQSAGVPATDCGPGQIEHDAANRPRGGAAHIEELGSGQLEDQLAALLAHIHPEGLK